MIFYSDQLSSIAGKNFQLIGEDFQYREVNHDNLNRPVLHTEKIGGEIVINAIGTSVTLCFHVHSWCGTIVVIHNGCIREIDLFRSEHGFKEVNFYANTKGVIHLRIICGAGCRNPQSNGDQTWLLGVIYDTPQPWLPSNIPVSNSCDLAFGKYGSFLIHSNDSIIGRKIALDGIWAPHDVKFYEQHISSGMVVLDIGTNIGHHLVVFSKLVGRGGFVAGFEPQRVLYRLATANLVINDCDNADIFPFCLGDNCGHVKMSPINYRDRNNFGALGVNADADAQNSEGEKVPVRTLDDLMCQELAQLNRLDFIKIDVQSFELFVLKGGVETIKKFKPKLFLEISPYWMKLRGYDYLEIYSFLGRIGYQFLHTSHDVDVSSSQPRLWNGQENDEWDVYAYVPT